MMSQSASFNRRFADPCFGGGGRAHSARAVAECTARSRLMRLQ